MIPVALDRTVKVELPPHSVKIHSKNGIYVQYTVRAYRNEKGKPTSERVSIGKLDPESGMLIPNKNYYELFDKEQRPSSLTFVRSCGSYAAFSGVSKALGLTALLKKHFPEQAEAIMTVAHYMLTQNNVMYYLPDWLEEHVSFGGQELTSAGLSRLFAGITMNERILFFNDWMKHKKSNEYIAYDVTSISSYGRQMESLEWGYNRDKENLPQINLGIYFGEESRLPLYYRVYPGSIPDKAHLKYMTEDNGVISCKKARFVMDRGFYSGENLLYFVQKGCRFIIALPGHLKYCVKLIDDHREELINRTENYLGKGKPYGKAYEVEEPGFRMRVHLYYDPYKAICESEALHEEIDRMENELAQMETPPDRKIHYDRYFYINRAKDGSLAFRRNVDAINKALSRCGFFLIGETDFKKTTAEVLEIYRCRDVIEKSFCNLKNDIDMRMMYVQSDDVAEGKMFVAFIALIVRTQMYNCLKSYMYSHKYTFQKILLELDKAKLIHSALHPDHGRLLNPPTKIQKDIFYLLSLDPLSLDPV